MTSYATLPTYDQQLLNGKFTNKVWYFFFKSLYDGQPAAAEYAVTVSSAPFTFVAPQKGFLIVNGGTVQLIQFSRSGTVNYTTGQTSGVFPLSSGDSLIIRWSVAPTVTFVPQ
jgi:hypothetical protein